MDAALSQASVARWSGHPAWRSTSPISAAATTPSGNRIRFWGHDGALEVPFFVDVSALLQFFPETPNIEARILATFDVLRDRIIAAAGKVYSARHRRAFYVLAAGDFS